MRATSIRNKIRDFMAEHSDAKPKDVAMKFNVSVATVYSVRQYEKTKVAEQLEPTPTPTSESESNIDLVNHPDHYKVGGIETIDFIEAKKLNYHLGNVVKYITRADYKDARLQDLQKAMWYLTREINRIQA